VTAPPAGTSYTNALQDLFALPEMVERTCHVPGPQSAVAAAATPSMLLDLDPVAMDATVVDLQVLSHSAPGLEHAQGNDAPALARAANDAVLDAVARQPTRLRVPAHDGPRPTRRTRHRTEKGRFLNGIARLQHQRHRHGCAARLSHRLRTALRTPPGPGSSRPTSQPHPIVLSHFGHRLGRRATGSPPERSSRTEPSSRRLRDCHPRRRRIGPKVASTADDVFWSPAVVTANPRCSARTATSQPNTSPGHS